MIRFARPSRWALLVVAAATLVLAGCGRKAGLDLPPGAAAEQGTAAEEIEVQREPAAKGGVFDSSFGANAPPTAAKGRKKPFLLDPLLD